MLLKCHHWVYLLYYFVLWENHTGFFCFCMSLIFWWNNYVNRFCNFETTYYSWNKHKILELFSYILVDHLPIFSLEFWWAFQRDTLPAQAEGQPTWKGESGVAHFLEQLHLLIQEVLLWEVTEMRVCADRAQAYRSKEPGSGSSPWLWRLLWCPKFSPLSLRRFWHIVEENRAAVVVAPLRVTQHPCAFLSQFTEVALGLQSHIIMCETEA